MYVKTLNTVKAVEHERVKEIEIQRTRSSNFCNILPQECLVVEISLINYYAGPLSREDNILFYYICIQNTHKSWKNKRTQGG